MSDLGGFSLHDLFRAEAEQHAGALSEGLVKLEQSSDAAAIEPLMRAAHSIKGAARVIGLDIAVRLAHAMEDVLVAMQKGRERVQASRIDQLLRGTDLLASLAGVDEADVPAWSASHEPAVDAAIASLRAGPEDAASPEPPAPGPAVTPPAPGPTVTPLAPGPTVTPPALPADPSSASAFVRSAVPALSAASSQHAHADSGPSPATPSPASPAPAALGSRREEGDAQPARASSIRVSAEKLDRLLQLAGETMLESRRLGAIRDEALGLKRDLERLEDEIGRLRDGLRRTGGDPASTAPLRTLLSRGQSHLGGHLRTIENAIRRGEETSAQLYHEVLGSRMRPFVDATAAIPRTVRDLSRTLGKEVRLEISGESVPVDRDILARLEAPLNHLVRNALDHGIETPDERRSRGKPAQATLRVEARHHAGQLRVRVTDDGRGIDIEQLRAKIVRRGLAASEMAAAMDRQELLEFLFLPGFSTAQQVTEISGRGVGLDVVQSMAREFGGIARIETAAAKGTAFELELPITLSVVRALLVEVAGEILAFPLARIDRVVEPGPGEVTMVAGRSQFMLDADLAWDDGSVGIAPERALAGRVSVGVVEASRVLALGDAPPAGARRHIVVLGSGAERYGFAVEALVGEEDLVVRPLDPRLGKVAHVAAAAVRESGEPVLIVDTEDVLQSVRVALNEGRLRGAAKPVAEGARRAPHALVVDDSATVREVERQILVRMGFVVETAVDGIDGLHALRAGDFDLVVSDIDMPRMGGIEFVRTLRGEARFASVPVIVVSYKDREEDRLAGLDAGATAYLTKGAFRDSTFADAVRDLVDLRGRAEGGAS